VADGPERDEIPLLERRSSSGRIGQIEGWFAAAAVAAIFWGSGFYEWFVGYQLASWAFLVGLPFLAWVAFTKWERDRFLAIWAAAGAALLFLVAVRAFNDAGDYHHHNCWTIEERAGGVSIWECVPGHGQPIEYSSEEEYRFCDLVDESSSRGTIWRCEEG
jgi:hypothetical protein